MKVHLPVRESSAVNQMAASPGIVPVPHNYQNKSSVDLLMMKGKLRTGVKETKRKPEPVWLLTGRRVE